MNGSQSLAGLCAVCYAEQPKYRCPRCKSQTCSLPCYQKHQERAACNGVRDPAAFVKKSQWATANGIDHDYNYLKSVERQIERASEDVKSRVHQEGVSRKHNPKQGEVPLQRYLTEHQINLVRAPNGMSRSRINKTRVTGSGKVVWTIEWVNQAGESYMMDDNSVNCTIEELHTWSRNKRSKALRSRQDSQGSSTEPKTKRAKVNRVKPTSEAADSCPSRVQHVPKPTVDSEQLEAEAQVSSTPAWEPCDTEPPYPAISEKEQHNTALEQSVVTDDSELPSESKDHYYLKGLQSGGNRIILTPLDAQVCLTAALSNHTIHEFPTIVVLPYASTNLPPVYTLVGTSSTTKDPNEDINAKIEEEISQPSRPLDPRDILAMLKRDMHVP